MITDFRINEEGGLEGKAIPPAKWEEMYTKADVVAMLMDLYLLFSDCQTVEECFTILNKQIADLKKEQ